MLQAEVATHLRAAAFSSEESLRWQHVGVTRWLEEFLSGLTLARYAEQAHQRLATDVPEGAPEGGSDWMESDRIEE